MCLCFISCILGGAPLPRTVRAADIYHAKHSIKGRLCLIMVRLGPSGSDQLFVVRDRFGKGWIYGLFISLHWSGLLSSRPVPRHYPQRRLLFSPKATQRLDDSPDMELFGGYSGWRNFSTLLWGPWWASCGLAMKRCPNFCFSQRADSASVCNRTSLLARHSAAEVESIVLAFSL